jgi:hypothetical protein
MCISNSTYWYSGDRIYLNQQTFSGRMLHDQNTFSHMPRKAKTTVTELNNWNCHYPPGMRNKLLLRFVGCIPHFDRLNGLVVRVLGYRSGGLGSIPGTTRKKKVVGLERGPLSLVSTTEELLDRKVAAPV